MMLGRIPPGTRRKARIALYGSLASLVLGLVAITLFLDRRPVLFGQEVLADTEYAALPEVQLLRGYVRVDTSAETGSELDGALFLAKELERMGLEPHIERLGEGRANLWAILEGEERDAVVLHSHIDVFPVQDPDRWDFPPFEGRIDKAWIYGRGVFDMKSVAIAQLEALRRLAERGIRPRRSVIFLATGGEEGGSELGTRWILDRHPELAERFWTVLTEGGVVEPVTHRKIKYWGIEFAQKRFANGWLCSFSKQRLEELVEDLTMIGQSAQEWLLAPEVETFLAAYGRSRDRQEYRQLLSGARDSLLRAEDFLSLPRYIQALFRSEVVAYPVEENPEGGWRSRLAIHLLPGDRPEELLERQLPPWMVHGVAVEIGPPLGSTSGSSPGHPAFGALEQSVAEMFPEAAVGPYFLSWAATDARFFREAGIPSFGFSPFVIFNTDTFRVDTANERISLPGFTQGVDLYAAALERLAS